VLFGQVKPTALRGNRSVSEIAPIVVTSHTTTVVAAQDAMPLMVSPRVNSAARNSATRVNARPVPPRSSDAYPWGSFKQNSDRIACATENNTTATMNPDTDTETPGTTQAAPSNPIAHDPRSTSARSRICLMAISVGLAVGSVKNSSKCHLRTLHQKSQILGVMGLVERVSGLDHD